MPRNSRRQVASGTDAGDEDSAGGVGVSGNSGGKDGSEEAINEEAKPMIGGSDYLSPSTVTLSGLLNAIDGVSSQVGPGVD
jgi:hypothetical protein